MGARGLTIGALASASGLSRSTLLYYDRLGLVKPRNRSTANYRLYSENEVARLEQVCVHRRMGIPLKEIRKILEDSGEGVPLLPSDPYARATVRSRPAGIADIDGQRVDVVSDGEHIDAGQPIRVTHVDGN